MTMKPNEIHPGTLPEGAAMIEERLDRLSALMTRMFRMMMRLTRIGCDEVELTAQQVQVLAVLEDAGPMTIGELRAHSHAAQSSMSEMAGRLARQGLVKKQHDREDRRVVRVAITPKGRAMFEQRRREMRERNRRVLEALTPEEQERFLTAFETIVALTDRAAGRIPVEGAELEKLG